MNEMIWAPGTTLEMIEKRVILDAFKFYQGVKTVTAQSLGIAIRTLDAKLEKYKLDDAQEKERQDGELEKRREFLKRQRGSFDGGNQDIHDSSAIKAGPAVDHAGAGVHLESAIGVTAKHAVPLPERKEVQSVSPQLASKSGASGRR